MKSGVELRSSRAYVFLAAACVAAAVLAASATEAGATFPGANGKLAFHDQTFPSFQVDIYVSRADGTGVARITNDAPSDYDPAWSADGKRIAYLSQNSGSSPSRLMVAGADGRNPIQLATYVQDFAWSADGTQIVFVYNNLTGSGNRIKLVSTADENPGSNEIAQGTGPDWSPDGSKIAFSKGDDVFTIRPDGEEKTQLTEGKALDANPSWSPDGTKIVFSRADGNTGWVIHTMDPDGENEAPVGNEMPTNFEVEWAPDGTKFYFGDGSTININGTGLSAPRPDGYGYSIQSAPVGKVPPTAGFTASRSVILPGETVSFSSTATPGTSPIAAQLWDLEGDGGFNDASGPSAQSQFFGVGEHEVRLSVEDEDGGVDLFGRTIEVVEPPNTTIATGPGATQSSTPSFTFTSTTGVSFECSIDSGGFAPCSAAFTTPFLPDGAHMLAVRARDAHGFTDPTPATRGFSIDSLPATILTVRPPALSSSRTATFVFSADQPASFDCRLDGGPWVPCTSPWSYSGLADGSHSFIVDAIDSSGNEDPTPEVVFWTIDATAPALVPKPKKQQNPVAAHAVTVKALCPVEACKLSAIGSIALGAKTLKLKPAGGSAAAGGSATLKLKLVGKAYKAVRAALESGRRLTADLELTARDGLENTSEASAAVKLVAPRR